MSWDRGIFHCSYGLLSCAPLKIAIVRYPDSYLAWNIFGRNRNEGFKSQLWGNSHVPEHCMVEYPVEIHKVFSFQRSSRKSQILDFSENTVDGRNPAPVDSEFIPLFPFFFRVSIIRTRESHGVPTVLLVTRVPGRTGDAGLLLPGEPYRRGCRCAGAQAGLRLEGGDG